MIDIQLIRDDPERIKLIAEHKNVSVDIDKLLELDKQRRELSIKVDKLRAERNDIATKMKNGRPEPELIEKGRQLKDKISKLEGGLKSIDDDYLVLLKQVPNIPLDDVPVGKSEDNNVVARTVGEVSRFNFAPKNHWQISQAKDWMDKERAAKVTGARFAYLKGDLVKLQFALTQFIIDKLTDEQLLQSVIDKNKLKTVPKPFLPILPPLMIKTDIYDAMDRLEPRDDRYKIESDDLWLQGSAEHVLGSMHADEIIDEADLPLRYLGYATSFRREAGTYGKDMEGMFRMHQFDKLEMESLTLPENGLEEHLFLIAVQEELMQLLEIPYHVLMKCTADIGKPNARGVDIEAWMPGQDKYRETHTADYMTDYQSRRLKTRVRRADGKIELVHTNDATAMALSRGPITIIENFQDENGNVKVPKVLQKYLNGRSVL